ncbi:N-6 DNA methylase [Lacticaseibacillus paracasei]|nr:N-6 DNA methylase [Lacticaseibacillus paracasei]
MKIDEWIALIVEGSAELALLTLLLDNHLLKFERTDLLEHDLLRTRSASQFQKLHLNQAMDKQVHVYRILDSRKEKFKLSPAYQKRVSKVEELYTRPEIEVLYILNEGKYAHFKRSKLKPSEYVRHELTTMPKGSIKSRKYVTQYWQTQLDDLVKVIREYARVSTDPFDQTLAAILR